MEVAEDLGSGRVDDRVTQLAPRQRPRAGTARRGRGAAAGSGGAADGTDDEPRLSLAMAIRSRRGSAPWLTARKASGRVTSEPGWRRSGSMSRRGPAPRPRRRTGDTDRVHHAEPDQRHQRRVVLVAEQDQPATPAEQGAADRDQEADEETGLDRDPGVPRDDPERSCSGASLGRNSRCWVWASTLAAISVSMKASEKIARSVASRFATIMRSPWKMARRKGIEQDRHAEAEGMGGDAAIEAEAVARDREAWVKPSRSTYCRNEATAQTGVAEDQEDG